MSFPSMFPDNPLAKEDVPDTPLNVKLPANGFPMPEGEMRSMPVIVRAALAQFILLASTIGLLAVGAYMMPRPILHWLAEFQKLGLYLFALAIVCRPFWTSSHYATLLITVGHLATLMTASCCLAGGPAFGKAIGILLVEGYLLIAMEMGFHFHVLNRLSPTPTSQHPSTGSPLDRLIAYIGVSAFMLVALANSTLPLLGTWIVCTLTIVVGLFEASLRFKSPWRAVRFYLYHYFFYPSNKELVPGQIPSPSAHYLLRTGIIVVPCSALLSVAAFHVMQLHWFTAVAWTLLVPLFLLAPVTVVVGLLAPVISAKQQARIWQDVTETTRQSDNPVEQNSIFLGRVVADNSPVLVDRSLLFQHVHLLGTTGSGKTSLGLCPMIEQLIGFGDSTVLIIDLKGDSLELLAAAQEATQKLERERKIKLPHRVFTLENGKYTHAFNSFLTTGWAGLSTLEKTDILCAASGLAYGFEYGRSFFTAANSAVVTAANLECPNAMSFRQLHRDIVKLLDRDSNALHPELRRAGVHAVEVFGRLASYEALNVTPESKLPPEVLANQIDLVDCYRQPQVMYFRLPSIVSSIGAPSVARLMLYFLLLAGKNVNRRVRVHVFIDEFQRMATETLDHLLQLARSLDVSLILSNQGLNDLKTISPKIYSAVAGNCAIRQWFSASTVEDIAMLEKLMGVREQLSTSTVHSANGTGYSQRIEMVPRATTNDLLTVSENPRLNILQIAGTGKGYARYRGIPFMCQTDFHISAKEYERRKNIAWPTDLPGMMLAAEKIDPDQPPPPGPNRKKGDSDLPPGTWNPKLFEE